MTPNNALQPTAAALFRFGLAPRALSAIMSLAVALGGCR
jgi:hypothetical protein